MAELTKARIHWVPANSWESVEKAVASADLAEPLSQGWTLGLALGPFADEEGRSPRYGLVLVPPPTPPASPVSARSGPRPEPKPPIDPYAGLEGKEHPAVVLLVAVLAALALAFAFVLASRAAG